MMRPPQVGVIYFNNVGYLGMCGHGTIGLIASLQHAGKLKPGAVKIDTPVGPVEARLHEDGGVSVSNIVSHRVARQIEVNVRGLGNVQGDVAWGGNWFFLIVAAWSNHRFDACGSHDAIRLAGA